MRLRIIGLVLLCLVANAPSFAFAESRYDTQYEEDTDDQDSITDDDSDGNGDELAVSKKLFSKRGQYMKWFVYQSKSSLREGTVTVNASVSYRPGLKCDWKPDKFIVTIDSKDGAPKSTTGSLGSNISLSQKVKGGVTVMVGVGTRDGATTGCKFDVVTDGTYTR